MLKVDLENFKKFSTSTNVDGNYVGTDNRHIIRIIKTNRENYKQLLQNLNSYPYLVKSELISEDDTKLIVLHEKFDYQTYFSEWTKKQKVEAAKSIINLEYELEKNGFYLKDPHSFNITFQKSKPVYFDLGSIVKGKVKPAVWFVKSFCGFKENDYWDDVLGINVFMKLWISLRMTVSKNPLAYLERKIEKYSGNVFDNLVKFLLERIKLPGKLKKNIKHIIPARLSTVTNWTDYEQSAKITESSNNRTNNYIKFLREFKPQTLLDIGTNQGAFIDIALQHGVKEAIGLDVDDFSLQLLRERVLTQDLPVWTAKLNLMDYEETPGCYNSYLPAHQRLKADFAICFAVVHHVCYFGNSTFDEFAQKLDKFVGKIILIEFIPYTDKHLSGPNFKGAAKTWYTEENFIASMKKYFSGPVEKFTSEPEPRILLRFEKNADE